MHGEISGRTASGDVHPVGALNKTLISDTVQSSTGRFADTREKEWEDRTRSRTKRAGQEREGRVRSRASKAPGCHGSHLLQVVSQ